MFQGSQLFYAIPFYQEPPTYDCYNASGTQIVAKNCNKKTICAANSPIVKWNINETSEFSLQNWMTDPTIGLMCLPPY